MFSSYFLSEVTFLATYLLPIYLGLCFCKTLYVESLIYQGYTFSFRYFLFSNRFSNVQERDFVLLINFIHPLIVALGDFSVTISSVP